MDIYQLSGRLGRNPKRADGTRMSYLEQCAFIAGSLDVWFSLLRLGRTTFEEVAEAMQMSPVTVNHLFLLWKIAIR